MPNPWKVLGIEPAATLEEARHAYVTKAKLVHPDRHQNESPRDLRRAERRFEDLNAAWETIRLTLVSRQRVAAGTHEHDDDSGFEEGWYTDPYGRHEARWLSDGVPTVLVRDGGVESHDDPPDTPPTQTPVRAETPIQPDDGADLKRAGVYEDPYTKPHAWMETHFMLGDWSRPKP
jgi:hypothetical protein